MSRQNNSNAASFSQDYIQNNEQRKATNYSNTLSFLQDRKVATTHQSPTESLQAAYIADITEQDIMDASQTGKSYADKV